MKCFAVLLLFASANGFADVIIKNANKKVGERVYECTLKDGTILAKACNGDPCQYSPAKDFQCVKGAGCQVDSTTSGDIVVLNTLRDVQAFQETMKQTWKNAARSKVLIWNREANPPTSAHGDFFEVSRIPFNKSGLGETDKLYEVFTITSTEGSPAKTATISYSEVKSDVSSFMEANSKGCPKF